MTNLISSHKERHAWPAEWHQYAMPYLGWQRL